VTGPVIAAMIGLAAALLAATLNARNNRRLETRKQLATLATAAWVDMMQSFAENSTALRQLKESEAGASPDEHTYWLRKVVESNIKYTHSKARLATYGTKDVAELLATFERDGGFRGDNPKHQRVLVNIVQRLRSELDHDKDLANAEDIHDLLF